LEAQAVRLQSIAIESNRLQSNPAPPRARGGGFSKNENNATNHNHFLKQHFKKRKTPLPLAPSPRYTPAP
jgi:hypothetical protein